jgi:hypothetical protein
MTMADGLRLCFECRHEWIPGEERNDNAPPTEPFTAANAPVPLVLGDGGRGPTVARAHAAADILGPPDSEVAARAAQARLDDIIGRRVELEGGQIAWVRHFPDDDHVTVSLYEHREDDELVTVPFGDIVRELPEVVPVVEVPDEVAVGLGKAVIAVAGLAINAGLITLDAGDDDHQIGLPPTGWAPNDRDALPMLEQGVAYAIATLIFSYQLPRDDIARVAETFLTDAQADDTKGEES